MKKVSNRGRKTQRKIIKPALKKAINIVGGSTNLALEIGISSSKISDWLYTNREIPPKYVPKIVEATNWKVKPEELRPDVYIIKRNGESN